MAAFNGAYGGGGLIFGGRDGNWLYYGGAGSERLYKFVP